MSQAGFPPSVRLRRAVDFQQVFADGARQHSPLFTMIYHPNGLGYPRLGMAISKKRIRLAHRRQRLKRLLRESFRHQQHQLPGVDVVVLAKSRANERSNAQVFACLQQHWQRLAP